MLSEAPPDGPNNSTWEVNASTSVTHPAPPINVHAASTSTRPRSLTGTNPHCATAAANPLVRQHELDKARQVIRVQKERSALLAQLSRQSADRHESEPER